LEPVLAQLLPLILFWSRPNHDDEAILKRVRGQVSDLPVTSQPVEADRASSLGEQLAQADRLATSNATRAVVWFDLAPTEPGEILVVVAQPHTGRVLVRKVEASPTLQRLNDVDSVTAESIALVMRTLLRALAAGGEIGIVRSELSPPKPVPQPPVSPKVPPQRHRVGAFVDVGWRLATDGNVALQGVSNQLGVRVDRVAFGLSGTLGIPADEQLGSYATIAFTRHDVAAFFELLPFASASFKLGVGLDVGASFFPRQTLSVALGSSTPSQLNVSFLVGGYLTLRWLPWVIGPVVVLGADVVPSAPTFGVTTGGQFVGVSHMWAVQPRGMLAIELRTWSGF
jgi:hypothetical protein